MQTDTSATQNPCVSELTREHAAIIRLLDTISSLEPGPQRTQLIDEAGARFLTHAEAEERHLYPALRLLLPDGSGEAREQAKHQYAVGRLIEKLECAEPDGDEDHGQDFEALVGQFMTDVRRHVEQQDNTLFPALADACPATEVNALGDRLRTGLRSAKFAAERAAAAQARTPDSAVAPNVKGFAVLLKRISRPGRT